MIKWGILSTAKIATEQIIPAITESKNSIIRGIASRDIKKAKKILGWEPEISAKEMCKEMVKEDYKIALRHKLLKDKGFELPISTEN